MMMQGRFESTLVDLAYMVVNRIEFPASTQHPIAPHSLALVKEIVTQYGGDVWAESTEGKGATLVVRLPQAA